MTIMELYDELPVWQYHDYSYRQFDDVSTVTLEQAYQRNPRGEATVRLYSGGHPIKVHFSTMTCTEERSFRKLDVRRSLRKVNIRKVNVAELEKMFTKYAKMDEQDEDDAEPGIGGQGIMEWCKDMKIDPSSINLMVLFWLLNCNRKYFLTREQFVVGLAKLNMLNASSIKKKIKDVPKQIEEKESFRRFYRWCFVYFLDPNTKNIPQEIAIPTWKLLLGSRKWKYFDQWITFIETQYKNTISKDLWNQFFEFISNKSFDVKTFDLDMSAYPTAIDEFIISLKKGEQ